MELAGDLALVSFHGYTLKPLSIAQQQNENQDARYCQRQEQQLREQGAYELDESFAHGVSLEAVEDVIGLFAQQARIAIAATIVPIFDSVVQSVENGVAAFGAVLVDDLFIVGASFSDCEPPVV